MITPAVAARLAQEENVASLVLEAERAALAEVEHYRRGTLLLVAASWLRAELVHKRAQAKIKLLRERMAIAARVRQVQISRDMEALAGDTGTNVSILALVDSAIARVTEELAGISESS